MAELLTIGEVAEAAGVATSALRYYDEIGLLPPATRIGGQRRYTGRAVGRLRIVERCQRAGFTLEEIGRLLDGTGGWQRLARRKREELERRVAELEEAIDLVDAALACGCEHLEGCERAEHELGALPGAPEASATS